MSLLGVVADFMTHEFGISLQELETAHADIADLGNHDECFKELTLKFAVYDDNLKESVKYSSGYIGGSEMRLSKEHPVKPRIQQVERICGKYAKQRKINMAVNIISDLVVPLVPVSLQRNLPSLIYKCT